jgi:hypothetical protein
MSHFILPKQELNYENTLRKAGFELEFSNIDMPDILTVVQSTIDVKTTKKNHFLYKLESQYGNFTVELDFELLTQQKLKSSLKEFFKDIGLQLNEDNFDKVETMIAKLSKDVVPYEIGTPPLPLNKLELVDNLVENLNKKHAQGTKDKFYNAFGLHINLEVISLEAKSILRYLRAFLVLQDYIIKQAQVDIARKITPYINAFKPEYIKHVLNPSYAPNMSELIDDYITFNPTRNRSLDMLPLFAFIDEKRVRKALPDEKIKARPTFHYRLSNCLIGDKNWSVAHEWNRWIWVENLANDEKLLQSFCNEYLVHMNQLINFTTWNKKVEQWLQESL